MTCSKYAPMLSRLLDRELAPPEADEVENHLAQCHDCRLLNEAWQRQSELMRGHLNRHRLGDDFIAEAMRTASSQTSGTAGPVKDWTRPRPWVRWLSAAATVLLAAVVVYLLLSGRGNVSYARVIDPGALEILQSGSWVRATAGELLHPGAWLRNPTRGVPEILWRDSCRLTLEAGTLAHIPERSAPSADQLALICGSLFSKVQPGGADVRVSTPAGLVTAKGSFTIRVANLALSQLQIARDGSETLTGMMVPIGEVHVATGNARIEGAQSAQEVRPGTTAFFGASNFASQATTAGTVAASLHVVARGTEPGTLHESLHAAPGGISIQLDASNIGIRKLLQLATGAEVRGGEDTSVTGQLRIPVHADAESIASAVGTALDLPISFHRQQVSQEIAVGRFNPQQSSDNSPGEFSFEKSRSGRISFEFRSVPAGAVFQVLRGAANGLPELSAETAAVPISIQAEGLLPEEAAAWIERVLGLELRTEGHAVNVIEIGSPAAATPRPGAVASGVSGESLPRIRSVDGITVKDKRPPAGEAELSAVSQAYNSILARDIPAQLRAPGGRPLWSILDLAAGVPGLLLVSGVSGGGNAQSTGAVSPKKRQFLGAEELLGKPGASTHIIWPTLGLDNAAGAEADYVVANHTATQAHSIWNGYDSSGQLVIQYEYLVSGRSTLSLLPARDLPSCLDAGGHWETCSDVPLAGTRGAAFGDGLGLPAVAGQFKSQWAVPSTWLILGARIWMANPGGEQASVLVSIAKNGSVVSAEQLDMPPHAGMIWPGDNPFMRTGLTVIVSVRKGIVASGLR